jgi:hypothetical protein
MTTFLAPAAVPAGGAVTVTATSVTDATKSAQAIVNITGTASLASLNGHYAFLVQSPTGSRGTATWVGSVILDGTGKVSGGVEDVVSPTRDDQNDPILATGATNPNTHLPSVSAYSVDPSGHGQIIMSTLQGETLTISFEITSGNSSGVTTHAEVIEADGTGGEAGDPGSGSLDLQSTSATISGAYSFTVTGVNATSPYPVISLGGVINVTNATTIGGSIDTVFGGVFTSASITQGNLLTGPDANLRGTFSIVAPGAPTPSHSFTYYAVSSKVLRIFDNGGSSFTGGSMYSQGSSPSTGLSNSYVYQHSGWSTAGRTVAVGQLTASSGTISGGFSDSNSGGKSAITPKTPTAVSGSYAASATESGTINVTAFTDAAGSSTFNVYPVDPTLNILDPNNSTGGGGALVLHTDAGINGTGILLPQVSPKVFSSNYAVNLLNAIDTPTPNEVDLVGILTSDGSANFTANLADYTQASVTPAPQIDTPLSGTFTADPNHSGRYTGSLSVTSLASGYSYPTAVSTPTATKNTFNVAIYQATTSQAFVIETDNQAITIGQIVQQNLP